MDDTDRAMDDFRIELFIFPDGTAVEMMVFDRQGPGSGHPAPSASAPERAGQRGASAPAPAPSAPSLCTAQCGPDAPETTTVDAHVCPLCHGDLVHPVEWERVGDAVWRLRLRCPECETERCVEMGRPQVEQLNRELYHGSQELAREAERVSRQNFEDEARRFVAALQRGDIEPIDF